MVSNDLHKKRKTVGTWKMTTTYSSWMGATQWMGVVEREKQMILVRMSSTPWEWPSSTTTKKTDVVVPEREEDAWGHDLSFLRLSSFRFLVSCAFLDRVIPVSSPLLSHCCCGEERRDLLGCPSMLLPPEA